MYRGGRAASPPQRRSPSPQRRGRGAGPRRRPRALAQALLAAGLVALSLRALLRFSASGSAPQAAIPGMRCYVGTSDDGGALATKSLPAGHVCSSYRLRCSAADAARGVCTEAEAEAAHTRHVYAIAPLAECEQLAQAAAYHHGRYSEVDCCADAPLCNGGGGHLRAGGEAAGRVVRCAAGASGAITAVVPADGGRCVRYGTPCAAGAPGCTPADVAAGRMRTVLGSASAEACAAYALQPEAHAQLLCCAEEMCNDGRAGGFGAPGVPHAAQGTVRRAGADRARRTR